MFHVPEKYRIKTHPLYGYMDTGLGNNGVFAFKLYGVFILCIASDGAGWDHVSVSLPEEKKTPSWEIMATVKDLFWDDEDAVVQYHPPRSKYVNFHPGVLHLWKPQNQKIILPDPTMVGPK